VSVPEHLSRGAAEDAESGFVFRALLFSEGESATKSRISWLHPFCSYPAGEVKLTTTVVQETLAQLAALGNEKMRAQNSKHGAGGHQFGVRLGDIRNLAAKIKTNHELAMALWATGNIDARLLAILLMKPKNLSAAEMDRMVRAGDFVQVADWLNAYIVSKHPDKEALRQAWLAAADPWAARAGWSLTSARISSSPEGLDLPALLERIQAEMAGAAPEVQWTMNFCLAGIGIHFPQHRTHAIAIGETLGVYRDYPVSKGCTSPFAPIWINEIVRRQG
jgi:3-methyladenine DNA glycosylase AlkD